MLVLACRGLHFVADVLRACTHRKVRDELGGTDFVEFGARASHTGAANVVDQSFGITLHFFLLGVAFAWCAVLLGKAIVGSIKTVSENGPIRLIEIVLLGTLRIGQLVLENKFLFPCIGQGWCYSNGFRLFPQL